MTHNEYFAQDILVRINQAELALDQVKTDPIVLQDHEIGITIADVLHDAYVTIGRLRATKPA
jgi:hypothetical protein